MGPNLSPVPEVRELRTEVARLRSRIALLEAERDEFAQQNAELFVLQQVFSTINSTLDINDMLSMVMRGVIEAIKFKRVILFDVLHDGLILRRLEGHAPTDVVRAADPLDYIANSTLTEVARGRMPLATGAATDADAPMRGVRRQYCLAPLVARGVIRGLLYADDPPSNEITENHLRMLLDFASQAAIAVENTRLYEETRRLLEETQQLALTDSLTGIANRRALETLLERELHTSVRYGVPFAFLILDLDDLKKVNDTSGHGVGDLALQRFAQTLVEHARKGDIVARYAGDEFVVVLSRCTAQQAERTAARLLGTLQKGGLAASIGVAMFPADAADAPGLFAAADDALYKAKQDGKGQYRFHAHNFGSGGAGSPGSIK